MNEIRFYKVNESFGFLSNFWITPILINSQIWRSVEHYFQASKFQDEELRIKIRELESPMDAAKEGRNRKNVIRTDWEEVKDSIMIKGLYAKFLQHHELKKLLLDTNNSQLIEDTVNDNYWGNGGNDSGQNKLGLLLMEVRSKINAISDDVNLIFPPWIAFPNVSQLDLFWRMGIGEDYLSKWHKYLSSVNQKQYKEMFPMKSDWLEVYDE